MVCFQEERKNVFQVKLVLGTPKWFDFSFKLISAVFFFVLFVCDAVFDWMTFIGSK
jgi:hypothetical protein